MQYQPTSLYIHAKVYLNVYDLKTWLNCCECLGIGAYHTAVEIKYLQYYSVEWSTSTGGQGRQPPGYLK